MEKMRVEDMMLEGAVLKYTNAAFREYEPYSPCICKSGKKFKWCCYPGRKESKAWKMTHNIINDLLTKKKIRHKIKRFEGATHDNAKKH